MDKMKCVAFMAIGAIAALMYERYNEPVKDAMKKAIDMEMNMAMNALDDMM